MEDLRTLVRRRVGQYVRFHMKELRPVEVLLRRTFYCNFTAEDRTETDAVRLWKVSSRAGASPNAHLDRLKSLLEDKRSVSSLHP